MVRIHLAVVTALVGIAGGVMAGCGGAPDDDVNENEELLCDGPLDPGPAPIRRLTRAEYNNTVFQLVGDNSRPADAFVADGEALGFSNQAVALSTSSLLVEQWLEAAETVAEKSVDKILKDADACAAPVSNEAACEASAEAAIASFGQRAFRRPLDDGELAAHTALFVAGAELEETFDAREGMKRVIEAMLQSPHFLYRVEFGAGDPVEGDVVALTSWEVASRLSYLLWNTMPDVGLFEAAAADELRTPEQIEAQARRMLDTPRAREAVKNFHRQWLDIENIPRVASIGRDAEIYPDYSDSLIPLYQEETEQFIDYAVFEENASAETLFTASYTMMNKELADFYGVEGPEGEAFERVDLDPAIYSGILTHAGLLALHSKNNRSSPIHRGIFVREALLCQTPPAPPDNIPPPPEVDREKTTREQFGEHTASGSCSGCHKLFDPVGFGFEHFDGIGRYRADEWGNEIDASGEILNGDDASGTFDGVVELGQKLGQSDIVRDCISTQWFRFSYGRGETDADACSMEIVNRDFAAANYDIKELLVALTQTPAFRYRHSVTPGGDAP
jgi:hypothetical protein